MIQAAKDLQRSQRLARSFTEQRGVVARPANILGRRRRERLQVTLRLERSAPTQHYSSSSSYLQELLAEGMRKKTDSQYTLENKSHFRLGARRFHFALLVQKSLLFRLLDDQGLHDYLRLSQRRLRSDNF